jgi:hypothetical protein
LTAIERGNTVSVSGRREMRNRLPLGMALLVALVILASAAPAYAVPRFRLYKGETSQGERIKFVVAKTDAGRFVSQFDLSGTLTCDDQSTTVWGIDFFLGRREVPITDRAFSYDANFGDLAVHVAGDLGSLQGEGTASMISATLTEDEQAQLCSTGDLTWSVEFVRWL